MSAWWTSRTKTGRVVYDRKPRPMRWRDAERIAHRLVWNEDDLNCWALLLGLMYRAGLKLSTVREAEKLIPEWATFQFGGGGFGGGGASREIDEAETKAPGYGRRSVLYYILKGEQPLPLPPRP